MTAPAGTPPEVAAAAAAYAVLVAEPGARKDVLDAAYNAALKKVEDASTRGKGVAVGRAEAGFYEVRLASFAGDAPIKWTYFADELNVERSWPSLQAMTDELVQQRVWSGVHFRSAALAGRKQGRDVANYVLANALQPKP